MSRPLLLLSSETSTPVEDDSPQMQPPKKQFKVNLPLVLVCVIAVLVVAVALVTPPSSGVIPLLATYKVGEQMTYNVTVESLMDVPDERAFSLFGLSSGNATLNGNLQTEVIAFDGEFYTLNQTITMSIGDKPCSFSYLEKMNKTGYSTGFFDMQKQISSNVSLQNLSLTQLLNYPEIKDGDTINIQIGRAHV